MINLFTNARFRALLVAGIIAVASVSVALSRGHQPSQNGAQPDVGAAAGEQRLPFPAPRDERLRLFIVGDLMLGRAVETLMKKHGEDYPFARVTEKLAGADVVMGNLEGPIPDSHAQTPDGSLRFSFLPSAAALLARQNIGVVSVANNHANDAGRKGFEQTRTRLDAEGVVAVGDPSMKETSCAAIPGVKLPIVVCAFSVFANFDEASAMERVREARALYPSSYLILMPHWGNEYQSVASAGQVRMAHAFVDAGADLIAGSHPHVVQNIELYRDRPIFYSLGNFIFDQYFSQETQQGLALDVTLSAGDVRIGLTPLVSRRSQPSEMAPDEAERFRLLLAARSPEAAAAVGAGTLHLKR
ncbi:MAG: CapA family protein [Candidatus Kerfeldbacteria bacterium]|nr:CapA family protein [Candidatus Kerfeldbacteria bacterium]